MKEMIIENDYKIDASFISEDAHYSSRGCSFWNTYFVYATGGSRSAARANFDDAIEEDTGIGGDVRGCRAFGGVDTSCVWDNHLCVASQGYCCDGYSPVDAPYPFYQN